jgi:hypothetical protein
MVLVVAVTAVQKQQEAGEQEEGNGQTPFPPLWTLLLFLVGLTRRSLHREEKQTEHLYTLRNLGADCNSTSGPTKYNRVMRSFAFFPALRARSAS